MDYTKVMKQLNEMRDRYSAGFSSYDRRTLDELNLLLFNKVVTHTGCSDCYRDAYIIIFNKLKSLGNMPKATQFELKGGILLHISGSSKFYVNPIKDEDAIAYLAEKPSDINKFAHFPEDWEDQVEEYKKQKKAKENAEAGINGADSAELEALKEENESIKLANQELQAKLKEVEGLLEEARNANIDEEKDALAKKVAELEEENKTLKEENETLVQQSMNALEGEGSEEPTNSEETPKKTTRKKS